ncbi:MAG: aldehyde dehydrogenase EutE [Spirochaetes bacterium]|nr:aldehyde dehydrogenase EutE [Spirochaetota bacterium]
MDINEQSIRLVVAEVVKSLDLEKLASSIHRSGHDGIYPDINTAIAEAKKGQEVLAAGTSGLREKIISAMREAALSHLEEISRLAVEETGMGNYKDKIAKNRVAAAMTPGTEDIKPYSFKDERGMTLTYYVPYGVIGAITPSTNPTETIINNSIGMVAAGNSVVFNPHPSAKEVSGLIISVLNKAIIAAGGPAGLVCTVESPTIQSAQSLMNHPDIALLVVTGGPAVVEEALKSRKKVIAAGPGNPPCVVDETADIAKAAQDIVNGAGLDNNIVCICEKEILSVSSITDRLKAELRKAGAFELTAEQTVRVTGIIFAEGSSGSGNGSTGFERPVNKKYVGKDASFIAKAAGIDVPGSAKILFCEVDKNHPLVWSEQLMPVIPVVRMNTADEAIEFAVKCEGGNHHTAVIHSLNVERLSRMERLLNCSLFVKNGSSYNGLGFNGPGFTSFTIASPTGDGFTSARTFTREKRTALIEGQ